MALLFAAVALPDPAAGAAQESCPPVSVGGQDRMERLLWHPLIAEHPMPGDSAFSMEILRALAEERRRIGLIGLEMQEIRPLEAGDHDHPCAALVAWAKAQPGVSARSRFGFFEARDRYIVVAWAEPGRERIRLGWYQDTFIAFFDPDLELVLKEHW